MNEKTYTPQELVEAAQMALENWDWDWEILHGRGPEWVAKAKSLLDDIDEDEARRGWADDDGLIRIAGFRTLRGHLHEYVEASAAHW